VPIRTPDNVIPTHIQIVRHVHMWIVLDSYVPKRDKVSLNVSLREVDDFAGAQARCSVDHLNGGPEQRWWVLSLAFPAGTIAGLI